MNLAREKEKLLKVHRFALVRRDSKLVIYRSPEGKVYIESPDGSEEFRGLENQVTTLRRVVASVPQPEITAISAHVKREAERRTEQIAREYARVQLQKRRKGNAFGRTRGTGFIYDDPTCEPKSETEKVREIEDARLRREEEARNRALAEQFAKESFTGCDIQERTKHLLAVLEYVLANYEEALARLNILRHEGARLSKAEQDALTDREFFFDWGNEFTPQFAVAFLWCIGPIVSRNLIDMRAALKDLHEKLSGGSVQLIYDAAQRGARLYFRELRKRGSVGNRTKQHIVDSIKRANMDSGLGIYVGYWQFTEERWAEWSRDAERVILGGSKNEVEAVPVAS